MSTRSRSIATHFIAPGGNSDALVTGTNPVSRGAPALPRHPERWGVWGAVSGPTMFLVRLEAEDPRRVLRGDLASVLLGSPGKDAVQKLPGLRPGRLRVREVAPPEHVVDADRAAQLDAEVVLHELHEHVAAPVIARQESLPRLPSPGEHRPLSIGKVHLLQPVRNPRHLVLDGADLQPGIPIEDAREDHRGQRVAHPVVRRGTARPGELAEVHSELAARDAAAGRSDVQEKRQPDVLRGPPEALVDRVTIGPISQRRDGNERPDQPEFRAAFQLLTGLFDIVHVEHGDALQAIGRGLAEVRDPVVVDAADGREHGAVRDAVPEEALARLQTGPPDTVHLVLLDHRLRIVRGEPDVFPQAQEIDLGGILEPLSRLHHRAQGADLQPVDEPRVVLTPRGGFHPLHPRRPLSEPGLDPARVQVRWLDDVGICRDELVRRHRTPPRESTRPSVIRRLPASVDAVPGDSTRRRLNGNAPGPGSQAHAGAASDAMNRSVAVAHSSGSAAARWYAALGRTSRRESGMRVCHSRTVSTEASAPRSLVMTSVGALMRDRISVRSMVAT